MGVPNKMPKRDQIIQTRVGHALPRINFPRPYAAIAQNDILLGLGFTPIFFYMFCSEHDCSERKIQLTRVQMVTAIELRQ